MHKSMGGRMSALFTKMLERWNLARIRILFEKYHNLITYLFFGALTTLVNFLVYFPLYNWVNLSGTFSNILAWFAAVAFAFLTNKPFVFQSNDWSSKTVVPELIKFVGCRISSGLLETISIYFFVDMLLWNGNWVKIAVSILVVVLNYVFSKMLVFKK